MDIDIIIYAVIAVLLFAKLWSVFGRRNDDEPERPNPLMAPARKITKDDDDAPFGTTLDNPAEAPLMLRPLKAAPASLAGGLEKIKSLDPFFDEKRFLQGARAAFILIVEDFAKGDLATSTRLLGSSVLSNFQKSIDDRRQASETMEGKVTRIKDAEVTAVRMDDTRAYVSVRFISEQRNILRDQRGTILSGSPDHIEEITDQWVFMRDLKSDDPNWILVETKN